MTFQDLLWELFERDSEGMDTSSQEYLDLCLKYHICLLQSADARRRFASMMSKHHSKPYVNSIMAHARRVFNEAKDLQQMRGEQGD